MSMMDYGFGYDPEVPGGFQDADLEMAALEESARAAKTAMHCNECGANFKKKLGKNTTEVKCPKCGGYDTDL